VPLVFQRETREIKVEIVSLGSEIKKIFSLVDIEAKEPAKRMRNKLWRTLLETQLLQ
jgi:hypothetical protein